MTVIYVDLDEVLVDFIGGVCRLLDFDRPTLERFRPPGQWYISGAIEKCLTLKEGKETKFNQNDLEALMFAAGQHFWEHLEPLPWFEELVQLLDCVCDENLCPWYILTSPFDMPECREGKIVWMKKYFGEDFDRYIISHHKHLLANERTLLIDDRLENCISFERHKGTAILFPSPGNMLAHLSHNPIPTLKERLNASLHLS